MPGLLGGRGGPDPAVLARFLHPVRRAERDTEADGGEPSGGGPVRPTGRQRHRRPGYKALGADGVRAIKVYVAGGGRYVGFCMGAYLAGSQPGMGLLSPGNTGQYIRTRGASVTSTRNAVIPVRWEGTGRRHFAQDPPYIIPSGVAGERLLSRFTNNRVNALVKPYGQGSVGVVGTHPEADRSWYGSKLWRKDKDGLDAARGLRLIEETMLL